MFEWSWPHVTASLFNLLCSKQTPYRRPPPWESTGSGAFQAKGTTTQQGEALGKTLADLKTQGCPSRGPGGARAEGKGGKGERAETKRRKHPAGACSAASARFSVCGLDASVFYYFTLAANGSWSWNPPLRRSAAPEPRGNKNPAISDLWTSTICNYGRPHPCLLSADFLICSRP